MILIDGNSVGFQHTAVNNLTAGTQQVGGVFGFVRAMQAVRNEYAGRIIVLWDGRSWRYDDYPEYKGNRKSDPKLVALKESWNKQKPYVARFLDTLGIAQMIAGNLEADDLVARLVRSTTEHVTMITGDGDWLQLVSDRVVWVDPVREKRVSPAGFKEETGFDNPWQFVQCKALEGDGGDNIKSVGGVGPVAARWIFEHFSSVEGLLNEAMTADGFAKFPKKIRDFVESDEKQAIYARNLKLVWLNHPQAPRAVNARSIPGRYNEARFLALCEELAFFSIVKDADRFLRPFTEITQEIAA